MRVHHIAFRTPDLERARSFYRDVVRLREVREHRRSDDATVLRSVWFAVGDAMLMLECAEANEPPIDSASMELVAFAVDASERDALRARLREARVSVEGETAYTTYFRDPDGRRIAVSVYDFDATK